MTDKEAMQQALDALEFIRRIEQLGMVTDGTAKKAITTLRERLAQPAQQPEQEPVAWTTMPDAYDWTFISGSSDPNGKLDGKWHPLYTTPQPAQPAQQGGGNLPPPLEQQPVGWRFRKATFFDRSAPWHFVESLEGTEGLQGLEPLYTAPQPRQWQGLTDEELKRMWVEYRAAIPRYLCFARAVEAKLREKNQKENPGVL